MTQDKNNPWKGLKLPNMAGNKYLLPDPEQPKEEIVQEESRIINGKYHITQQQSTYGLGLVQLIKECVADAKTAQPTFTLDDGSKIYRPLTFKETIEARINDYESTTDEEERLKLFNNWNDTCTGIAYKANSTRFKIIPQSEKLILLPQDYNQSTLPIEYDKISGIELDRTKAKYNELLTIDEVLEHEGWQTLVQGDNQLLKKYAEIVFKEKSGQTELMGFWLNTNTDEDYLRALVLLNLFNNSGANGSSSLSNNARFVRVSQR